MKGERELIGESPSPEGESGVGSPRKSLKLVGIAGMVKKVVEEYDYDRDTLIQIILRLQRNFGWLPKEVLLEVSNQLDVPLSRVYQIATFYKAFSPSRPKGRHMVRVCMGTACQIRGSPSVRDRMRFLLDIEPGETTPDMKFTFDTVNCVGCCAMGPVVQIDDTFYGSIKAADVEGLLKKYG